MQIQYKSAERWITVGGNKETGGRGTHVRLDENGRVTAGPKEWKDKPLDEVFALKRPENRKRQGKLDFPADPEPKRPRPNFGPGVREVGGGRLVGTAAVEVSDLAADPSRFQYKIEGVDVGTGVTENLADVKRFRPEFAGQLAVWHDPEDGQTYVVNGHHRFELAKRTGYTGRLSVYLIDAKNAKEARAIGALANLAAGHGTALDAASFLRDSGVTIEDLKAEGVSLKGKVAADGAVLAKLSDKLFRKIAGGAESTGRGLAIARHVEDPTLQDELYAEVTAAENRGRSLTDSQVEEMAREVAIAPTMVESQQDLFGGFEETRSLRPERAIVKSALRRELSSRARTFTEVSRRGRADTLAQAGNQLNVEQNRQLADESSTLLEVFDRLAKMKGPASDAINEAARELAERPRDAKRILDTANRRIIEALSAEAGGIGGGGEAEPRRYSRPQSERIGVAMSTIAEALSAAMDAHVRRQLAILGDRVQYSAEFKEAEHKRGSDGKFTVIKREDWDFVRPTHPSIAGQQSLFDDIDGETVGHDKAIKKKAKDDGQMLLFADLRSRVQYALTKWEEQKHPRANDGKFTSGAGGGGGKAEPAAEPEATPEARAARAPAPAADEHKPLNRDALAPAVRAKLASIERQFGAVNPDGIDTQARYRQADGSYSPQRQQLHAKVLDSMFAGKQPAQGQPDYVFMGGGPAAGKSSVIKAGLVTLPEGHVMIDPDWCKSQLPDYARLTEGKVEEAAAYAHEESSDMAKSATARATQGKYHAVLDSTGDSGYDKLAKKIAAARAAGHRIVGHYVTCDTATAEARATERAAKTGRHVPLEALRETHAAVSRIVPQAIAEGLFDEIAVYDTEAGGTPTLVASAKGKALQVHDQARWQAFLQKGQGSGN